MPETPRVSLTPILVEQLNVEVEFVVANYLPRELWCVRLIIFAMLVFRYQSLESQAIDIGVSFFNNLFHEGNLVYITIVMTILYAVQRTNATILLQVVCFMSRTKVRKAIQG